MKDSRKVLIYFSIRSMSPVFIRRFTDVCGKGKQNKKGKSFTNVFFKLSRIIRIHQSRRGFSKFFERKSQTMGGITVGTPEDLVDGFQGIFRSLPVEYLCYSKENVKYLHEDKFR